MCVINSKALLSYIYGLRLRCIKIYKYIYKIVMGVYFESNNEICNVEEINERIIKNRIIMSYLQNFNKKSF